MEPILEQELALVEQQTVTWVFCATPFINKTKTKQKTTVSFHILDLSFAHYVSTNMREGLKSAVCIPCKHVSGILDTAGS